jgi:hypothetical protein
LKNTSLDFCNSNALSKISKQNQATVTVRARDPRLTEISRSMQGYSVKKVFVKKRINMYCFKIHEFTHHISRISVKTGSQSTATKSVRASLFDRPETEFNWLKYLFLFWQAVSSQKPFWWSLQLSQTDIFRSHSCSEISS